MSLRGEELEVLTRFEPPLDLVVKRLHDLCLRMPRKELAFMLGIHPSTLWKWLALRSQPKRPSKYGAVILSNSTDQAIRKSMRELQTLPGARYVDRTKRKRVKPQPVVPAVASADDYSI